MIPPEIKRRGREREYVRALRKGRGKIPRCNLLILGEERVGKTSLYNLLTGQKFIVDRMSTFGIDNTMIVTMVDTRHIKSWMEVDDGKKKEMDAQAFQNEIARLIPPFDAREDKVTTPTEKDLLDKIDRALVVYFKNSVSRPPIRHVTSNSLEKSTSLLKPKEVQVVPPDGIVRSQQKDSSTPATGQPEARSPHSASPAVPSTTPVATPAHPQPQRPPTAATQPRIIANIKSNPSEKETGHILISRRHSMGIQKKVMSRSAVNSEPELSLNTFDFAGQKAYRPMHHCFITSRAMYIVVFNLRKFINEVREASRVTTEVRESSRESLEELRYWLHSIHAHIGKGADKESEVKQIVLVGTHRSQAGDEMSEAELQEIDEILTKEFLEEDHHYRCVDHLSFITWPSQRRRIFAAVENSHDQPTQRKSSGATMVQNTLELLAKKLPFLEEDYPLLYLHFEEVLVQYRQKLQYEHSSQVCIVYCHQ